MKSPTVTFFLRGGQKRSFRTAAIRNVDDTVIDVEREDKASTQRFFLEGDRHVIKKYIEWAKS